MAVDSFTSELAKSKSRDMKTQREGAAALFAEAEAELKKAEMLEVRDRTGKEVANTATDKLAAFG